MYGDKDYAAECDFLEEIFREFPSQVPKSVLDVACGAGGHSIPLAQRGYRVSGVDLSASMIGLAEKKAAAASASVDFHIADMRNFHIGTKFDTAISMFSALDYLPTFADLRRALTSVYKHLHPGSLFIFDFWNGLAVLDSYSPVRYKKIQVGNKQLIRVSSTTLNPVAQICEIVIECMVLEEGRLVDEFQEQHTMRFFFPEELKNYLELSGFQVLKTCPFMDIGGEVTSETWNVTCVASREA
jgi:2-polyprenyl-3-methyl-5-hydroxy-6-metoxy-1,4-benzoquinol methylase